MISIIIPTLNEEKVIAKTLENLSTIKSHDYEIIISDGKSTDKTLEIAKQYNPKIVVWDKPERQNIAQARNLGASIAQGDYLVFLDADVIVPSPDDFFARVTTVFKNYPNLVGLTGRLVVIKELAIMTDSIVFGILNLSFFFLNNITKTGGASGEFQIIPTEAFRKLNGFREDLIASEDCDMFARLAKIGKTRLEWSLVVHHTGRRVHKVGWLKIMWIWFVNWISVVVMDKSVSKEWHVVR